MNKFDKEKLLKSFKKEDDTFIIDNENVKILILDFNIELDLMEFYSKSSIKGIARCTLYFMLKKIIKEYKYEINNLKIGISAIVPSLPRRNKNTIIQTYKNMGFTNIVEENIELLPEDAEILGIQISEKITEPILYCKPIMIKTIIDKLSFCNKRSRSRTISRTISRTRTRNSNSKKSSNSSNSKKSSNSSNSKNSRKRRKLNANGKKIIKYFKN